jgi:hypothetical protein
MVTFKANRSDPELVPPALATPREMKALSDVDTQPALRFYATGVEFFRHHPIVDDGHDQPENQAKVVKDAVAKALTYFYPVAGRIRELPGGELVVECTGEGVVFVEADADVWLDEFGNPIIHRIHASTSSCVTLVTLVSSLASPWFSCRLAAKSSQSRTEMCGLVNSLTATCN